MLATQVKAYNMYLKTKYLDIQGARAEYNAKSMSGQVDLEIPLTEGMTPSLSVAIQKGNQYQSLVMNAEIHVSGNLKIEVEGHANMQGVFLKASSLEASFESLTLGSMQDIIENESFGVNLGISLSNLNLNGIGVEHSKRDAHVVKRLTAMLGETKAHIVVAHALRLNGAMIANAQVNEDGSFTDHGHLTLKVGELFV
ncbi:hypothetical protein NF27_FH00060, partial [Candidatus Jidaibacter acanthamoeba]